MSGTENRFMGETVCERCRVKHYRVIGERRYTRTTATFRHRPVPVVESSRVRYTIVGSLIIDHNIGSMNAKTVMTAKEAGKEKRRKWTPEMQNDSRSTVVLNSSEVLEYLQLTFNFCGRVL